MYDSFAKHADSEFSRFCSDDAGFSEGRGFIGTDFEGAPFLDSAQFSSAPAALDAGCGLADSPRRCRKAQTGPVRASSEKPARSKALRDFMKTASKVGVDGETPKKTLRDFMRVSTKDTPAGEAMTKVLVISMGPRSAKAEERPAPQRPAGPRPAHLSNRPKVGGRTLSFSS